MARKLVKSDSGDIVNLDNALTIKLVKTANRSGELERFWSIYTSANWAPDSVSEQDNGENFKAVELWVKRNMLSGHRRFETKKDASARMARLRLKRRIRRIPMAFEVSDFFAPSSFNGSYEPKTPLRKFLFIDCAKCRELNEAFYSADFHVEFSMISYWLEVKHNSIRGAIGVVSRYDLGYDAEWGFAHNSYVKFSDDGKTLRRGGDPRELEACEKLIARGDTSPRYPQILHLMNDHYDQGVLEKLVNKPGWIPNGCYGWFEDLPKRMLPTLPDRKL